MIWYIVVAVVAFVVGALVFRNNPVKGEAAAGVLEAQLATALEKVKELEAKLLGK